MGSIKNEKSSQPPIFKELFKGSCPDGDKDVYIHIKPVSSNCLWNIELPFPLVAFPGLKCKSNENWSWLFFHLYCFMKWKLWNNLLWNNLVFFLEMTLQWTRQNIGVFWTGSNPVNSKRVSRGSSLSCSVSSMSLRWYWKMIRYFICSLNDVEF